MFKRKLDENSYIVKYKARLTPQRCFKTIVVNFMDTYAPVPRMTTVRFVFALALVMSLHVSGFDFMNEFLNAASHDDIYVIFQPGCPSLTIGYAHQLKRALLA